MKTKFLFTAFSIVFAISGCKETCYECEKYEYCIRVTDTCPNGGYTVDWCYATEAERETERGPLVAGYQTGSSSACWTFVDFEKLVAGNQKEICDKNKTEAEDSASDLEITGFKCVQQ